MSAGGSRRRAALFAALAAACAVLSAAIAARYREAGQADYGPVRDVVVVERELRDGEPIDERVLRRSLAVREVPERFVPPDAFEVAEHALGARPRSSVPAGSYLLASQIATRGRAPRPELGRGLRPITVTVVASGSPAAGRSPIVDVVAADEPGSVANPRVRVLARRVPLVGVRPLGRPASGEPRRAEATLALSRADALAVIEAENFAGELRLLPRRGAG